MTPTVNGVPPNSSRVIPRLICRDPGAGLEFCQRAFNASVLNRRPGPDGSLAHALLTIGDEMLMIEAEWPSLPSRAPATDGSSSVVIYVYVPDVDSTIEEAVRCGARVVVPLQNQFWGDRTAWIVDPAGHVWTVASRVENATEEQRQSRWASILEQQGGGKG